MPGAVFGVLLADPECLPAQMVFAVQLIGVLVIECVGEQVHSRTGVEKLKSLTKSEGKQSLWPFILLDCSIIFGPGGCLCVSFCLK